MAYDIWYYLHTVMKSLSLIVPYYNRQENFGKMLGSLQAMREMPEEIILVNNLADDAMLRQVQCFRQDMIGRCEVKLETCSHRGACAARNKGLAAASCDYVYFFDSDDEMSPDFIERVHADIRNGEAELFVYVTRIIGADGGMHIRNYGCSPRPSYQILSSFLTTQSMVINKNFLLFAGGWNEDVDYWNDWELGIRLLLHHPKIKYFADKSFHKIYAHANSITGSSFSERFEAICHVFNIVSDEIDEDRDVDALYYRKAIIAGKIKHEGMADLAKQLFNVSLLQKQRIFCKYMSMFLYHYAAIGIPGAWKLATKF